MRLNQLHESTLKLPKVARDQVIEISKELVAIYPEFMEAVEARKAAGKSLNGAMYNVGTISYRDPYTGVDHKVYVDFVPPRPNDHTQAECLDTMDFPTITVIAPHPARNVLNYYSVLLMHELLHVSDPNSDLRRKKDLSRGLKHLAAGRSILPDKSYHNYISGDLERRVWVAEIAAIIRSQLDRLAQAGDKEGFKKAKQEIIDMLRTGVASPNLAWRYTEPIKIWHSQPEIWQKLVVPPIWDAVVNYDKRFKDHINYRIPDN